MRSKKLNDLFKIRFEVTKPVCLFYLLVFLAGCYNTSTKRDNSKTDTLPVNGYAQEIENVGPDENAESLVGRNIAAQNANLFLSRMLKEVAQFTDLSDSSDAIKINVLKNNYCLSGVPENFNAEYENVKTGSFVEGFGALRYNLIQTNHDENNASDIAAFKSVFREISDIEPIFQTEEEKPFGFYNPDAVEWCMNNFYRSPNDHSFTGVSYSTLYDIVFKKFVRTLFAAHYHVVKHEIQNEISWYKNTIIIEQKHAPAALMERYKISEKIKKNDINPYYYPYAAGFWIRRSIDGTESVLWKNLVRLITDYDYDWACVNYHLCERG